MNIVSRLKRWFNQPSVAVVKPLNGKYYGTKIAILIEENEIELEVWISDGSISDRFLQSWGFTRQQWEENIEIASIDDPEDGEPIRSIICCDSHYESETSYRIATMLAKKLSSRW